MFLNESAYLGSKGGVVRGPRHDEGDRPFAPVLIRHGDDRDFGYPRMLGNQLLELQRRYPLPACLDDVLHSVGDTKVAELIKCSNILRMQVALLPELGRRFSIADVT